MKKNESIILTKPLVKAIGSASDIKAAKKAILPEMDNISSNYKKDMSILRRVVKKNNIKASIIYQGVLVESKKQTYIKVEHVSAKRLPKNIKGQMTIFDVLGAA